MLSNVILAQSTWHGLHGFHGWPGDTQRAPVDSCWRPHQQLANGLAISAASLRACALYTLLTVNIISVLIISALCVCVL